MANENSTNGNIAIIENSTEDNQIIAASYNNTNLIELAEHADKLVEAAAKVKLAALRVTNQKDWVNMGGNPYLQVSGAEKIARIFGVSWTIGEPEIEEREDGHRIYTYKGVFSLNKWSVSIEAIGTKNSDSPFFTSRYINGQKIKLPSTEVDMTNVKKAAYTNCIGNGITRLLGLRNISYEDLDQVGIHSEKHNNVGYKSKSSQSNYQQSAIPVHPSSKVRQSSEAITAFLSEKQWKMIWAKLLSKYSGDREAAKQEYHQWFGESKKKQIEKIQFDNFMKNFIENKDVVDPIKDPIRKAIENTFSSSKDKNAEFKDDAVIPF